MRFTEPNLEVVLRIKPNGDFGLECNSRETYRAFELVRLAARQVRDRLATTERARIDDPAALWLAAGIKAEVVLTGLPDGRLVLRATGCTETLRIAAALKAVAARLQARFDSPRLAAKALLTDRTHKANFEVLSEDNFRLPLTLPRV